ncbi:MAG TPA: serine hydrolase domain-containing protein [Jiangellaceae bacterium]|nr:serine hydrolase domain-containing protein [Jiangellaceae bacterium]
MITRVDRRTAPRATVAVLVLSVLTLGCSTTDSTDQPTLGTPSADCSDARTSELHGRVSALLYGLVDDHPDTNGLEATWLETLEPTPAGVKDRAHQFVGEVDTYAWDPSFDLYGGGGLAATVRDMAVFTRALLTGDVFRKPETLSLMTETRVAPDQDDYGLGISAIEDAGERGWGHNGFWNTFSYHYPDLDATIAGSVSQRQAFDVSDALRREAIATIRG